MNVKIIKQNNQTALIEYLEKGMPQRCFVPASDIQDGKVTAEALEAGTPYGDDLAQGFRPFTIKAADITRLLREQGIFTLAELKANQGMFIKWDITPWLQVRLKLAALFQAVKE